jgi:hypothetical protein
MALPFCFRAFKTLRVTHFDSPPDGLRKHPTSCGLWTCCLTHNSLFSYIETPGHPVSTGQARRGRSTVLTALSVSNGLPGKETSF